MAARRTVTKTTTTRDVRVRSRQNDATGAAAPAETEGGMGFADAIVLGTTVLLIASFVMMDKVLGVHFGTGMFFKP